MMEITTRSDMVWVHDGGELRRVPGTVTTYRGTAKRAPFGCLRLPNVAAIDALEVGGGVKLGRATRTVELINRDKLTIKLVGGLPKGSRWPLTFEVCKPSSAGLADAAEALIRSAAELLLRAEEVAP